MAVWRKADSPHQVTTIITITGTLVLETGTIVCAAPNAQLIATPTTAGGGIIVARGTASDPIRFLAADPVHPWKGMVLGTIGGPEASDTSIFRHVTIENSQSGITAYAPVVVDSSRFRQISGRAIAINYSSINSRVTNSVIDTAGSDSASAVQLATGKFEGNTVRGSRGVGVELLQGSFGFPPPTLGSVHILGSASFGLLSGYLAFAVEKSGFVHITGGKSYPFSLLFSQIKTLWPTSVDLDDIRGNARDTAVLSGTSGSVTVLDAAIPWRFATYGSISGDLILKPGASVSGSMYIGSGLTVNGTTAQPVTLNGDVDLVGSGGYKITHAIVRGSIAIHNGALSVDSSVFKAGSSLYSTVPTFINRTTFDAPAALGTVTRNYQTFTANAGVVLRGAGSVVLGSVVQGAASIALSVEAPNVRIESSELRDNRVAVAVDDRGGGVITNSNIVNNGTALSNATAIPVDARSNWWGKNTGPEAAAIAGPADVSAFLTAPAVLSEAKTTLRKAQCVAAGTQHTGVLTTSDRWISAGNPHHLLDSVTIKSGTLTIEDGAVVCGGYGAAIIAEGGTLTIRGSATKTVVLTAEETGRVWGGLYIRNSTGATTIAYALIEETLAAINNTSYDALNVSDVRIRQNFSGFAITAGEHATIVNTVMDTAGGVTLMSGGYTNNVIRGGGGLYLSHRCCFQPDPGLITINGGRIEEAKGTSVIVSNDANFVVARPLRIVGSRGPIADLNAYKFANMFPTPASLDSLRGNPNDTILVGVGFYAPLSRFKIYRAYPVIIQPTGSRYCLCRQLPIDTLDIEPGATIVMNRTQLQVNHRFSAPGTTDRPIKFIGRSGVADDITGSDIAKVTIGGNGALSRLSNVSLTGTVLRVTAPGLRASQVLSQQSPLNGIDVDASDALFEQCDVIRANHDGIRVLAGSNVQIHDCNLENNLGFAVNNLSTSTVDATGNWWGSVAGPALSASNGVGAKVTFTPFRLSPRIP